jgi:alpha/beta superfamily hydrolase
MTPELHIPQHARGLALLLHPHPDFGGNRFHPFVDGLFRGLPAVGVGAARFDFSTGDADAARGEALVALDAVCEDRPGLTVVVAGYSFGAGIAVGLDDRRLGGWFLLAPQTSPLSLARIGEDPRPKMIVVPDGDQFSPPEAVARAVAGWESTTLTTAAGADHFLGNTVDVLVRSATEWVEKVIAGTTEGHGFNPRP